MMRQMPVLQHDENIPFSIIVPERKKAAVAGLIVKLIRGFVVTVNI